MLRSAAASLIRNFGNIGGWRTNRRIVVIESDDWGSIRVPSRAVFDEFAARGFAVASTQYNRLDALESDEDLSSLLAVLSKHRDYHGRPACVTANVIMANPDFDRIRASGFSEYHYEHFRTTLAKYPAHHRVFDLYRQGMANTLFHPQFHGREHLNVHRWMTDLKNAVPDVRYAFEKHTTYSGRGDYNYMEALDVDRQDEYASLKEILKDGLSLFRETFGYTSRSFIAPCYTWDSQLESVLHEQGVEFIQGGRHQYVPRGGFENYSSQVHYLGQRNTLGQIYLTRNGFFEPSLVQKSDWVDYTLASIRDAFRWKKPAIICSHRINFIGSIDEANRDRNLRLLDDLLRRVIAAWPDVEFMTSDKLGDLIKA
jgi:hypothetical protein